MRAARRSIAGERLWSFGRQPGPHERCGPSWLPPQFETRHTTQGSGRQSVPRPSGSVRAYNRHGGSTPHHGHGRGRLPLAARAARGVRAVAAGGVAWSWYGAAPVGPPLPGVGACNRYRDRQGASKRTTATPVRATSRSRASAACCARLVAPGRWLPVAWRSWQVPRPRWASTTAQFARSRTGIREPWSLGSR
jgi:hypothetical protein